MMSLTSQSNTNLRPKLFVLATKPSIPSQPHSSEWILDLSIPPATTLTASPSSPEPDSSEHRASISLTSNTRKESISPLPSSDITETEVVVPEKHYYFSRLQASSHTEEQPSDLTLQIFLTSFPTVANASSDHGALLKHFSDALEAVHLTPDPDSWLRQALLSLQVAEIVPPVSHGLDITKFMTFASSYLQEHLKGRESSPSTEVEKVNYSRVLQENERLRKILTPDAMGRASIAIAERPGDVAHDEDIWNLPVRGKPAKTEKHWGGFWLTHGPEADRSKSGLPEGSENGAPERRNVYGGLM